MRPACIASLKLSLLVTLSTTTPAILAAELRIERLFGPEIKTGPYKHPARIEELKNGDLYVVYYGGEGEYATDTGVFASRLKKGSSKCPCRSASPMTRFARLARRDLAVARRVGVAALRSALRRDVVHVTRAGQVSQDNAQTWSDAFPLVSEEGMMVCNKPIALHVIDEEWIKQGGPVKSWLPKK